jgi:isoleucyl-tRNA synthetase
VRTVLNPIWNAFHFFTLYANVEGYQATFRTDATDTLDRYLLAKTRTLVEAVTARMDAYDIAGACAEVLAFVEAVNNWYIRRSRERFWSSETDRDAFDTLYTALVTLCRVSAPLLPLVADEIHRGLTGGDSVHLDDWPSADAFPDDPDLVAGMDRVRQAASAALSLRYVEGLRVRLPLRTLTVAGDGADALAPFADLLRDEVNVKEVVLSDDAAALATFRLKPNGSVLGPLLGGAVQEVMGAAREGKWERGDYGSITVAGHRLEPGQFELVLDAGDDDAVAALPGDELIVRLDTEVTDELRDEGMARDLVRLVQQARKDRGLAVTDRIRLQLHVDDAVAGALRPHADWVSSQVLAVDVAWADDGELRHAGELDGHPVTFDLDVSASPEEG